MLSYSRTILYEHEIQNENNSNNVQQSLSFYPIFELIMWTILNYSICHDNKCKTFRSLKLVNLNISSNVHSVM